MNRGPGVSTQRWWASRKRMPSASLNRHSRIDCLVQRTPVNNGMRISCAELIPKFK